MRFTKLKKLIRKLWRRAGAQPEVVIAPPATAVPLEIEGDEFVVAFDLTNTSGRPERVELWRSKLVILRGDRNEHIRPVRSEPRAWFDGDILPPGWKLSAKVFFPYSPGGVSGAAWCLHAGNIIVRIPAYTAVRHGRRRKERPWLTYCERFSDPASPPGSAATAVR